MIQSKAFRIGKWLVQPSLNKISEENESFKVEPKVVRVLEYLAKNEGRLVTKEELFKYVWEGTVVTDNSLNRIVSMIRKIFNEDPYHPSYIETIAKSGYRLIKRVEWVESEEEAIIVKQFKLNSESFKLLRYGLLLFLVIVTAYFLLIKSFSSSNKEFKIIPFTSFLGNERMPQFSPDGKAIAFVREKEESNSDIYIKLLDTETPVRLTDHSGIEYSPSWSPDGSLVAFIREEAGIVSVVAKPYIGGPEKKLISMKDKEINGIEWGLNKETLYISYRISVNEPFKIYAYDLLSGTESQLSFPRENFVGDRNPTLSPNGKFLAFERTEVLGVEDIYVVSVEGGKEEKLTSDHLKILGLDWDPEGEEITFSSNRSGMSSLWKVSLSTKALEPLPGLGFDLGHIAYAPAGKYMAFEHLAYETNIWQLKLDGLSESRFISSTRPDLSAELSPLGDKFVFISERSGFTELWYCDRNGKNPVQLTHFQGPYLTSPRWSRDGLKVVFDARVEGRSGIFLIDIETKQIQAIIDDKFENIFPVCSVDGESIYYASRQNQQWQIWKASVDNKKTIQITKNGGYFSFPSVDGKYIYLTKKNTSGIWKLNLETQQEHLIIKEVDRMNWRNWLVINNGIYYIQGYKTRIPTLHFFNEKTGDDTIIKTLPRILYKSGLSYSDSTNSLFYTRVERGDSDIMLVESL